MADIRYVITVDEKGATKSIQTFDGAVKGVADTASRQASPALSGLWKQFALGQIVVNAASSAIRNMKEFLGGAVKAAAAQELAERNLADAFDITGRNAKALLPVFKDFANSIQNQTIYTDDAVLSATALMAQLSNLDAQGLQQATKGAIGLASVFKIDLKTAATTVAKAMGGSYEMLSRYGIKVGEIKTEEGKRAKVLEELSRMYGRAQGETSTFSGALAQLKNQWDEVKETVGGAITQNSTLREGISTLTEKVKNLAQSDDFKLWLSTVVDGLVKAVELVGKFAKGCKDLTEWLARTKHADDEFEKSQQKLNEALDRAREAGHDLGNKVLPVLETSLANLGNTTGNVASATQTVKDKSLGFTKVLQTQNSELALAGINLREYLGGLKDAPAYYNAVLPPARDMNEVLRQASDTVLPALPPATKKATESMRNYFDGLYNDIARGFGECFQKIKFTNEGIKIDFKSLFTTVKESFFRMVGEMTATAVLNKFKEFFSGIASHAASAGSSITDTLGGALKGIGSGIEALLTGLGKGIANMAKAIAGSAKEILITAAIALAIYSGFRQIKGIWDTIFGGGKKGGENDLAFWLKLIYEDLGVNIMWKFDALKASVDLSRDSLNPMVDGILQLTREHIVPSLSRIVDYTSALKNIQYGQHGLDMTVARPTLFAAGERNTRERVKITPGGGDEPGYLHADIYIGGTKVDTAIVKLVRRAGQLGRLTFPGKVIPAT